MTNKQTCKLVVRHIRKHYSCNNTEAIKRLDELLAYWESLPTLTYSNFADDCKAELGLPQWLIDQYYVSLF